LEEVCQAHIDRFTDRSGKGRPEKVIEELYVRCVSRKPTSEETEKLEKFLGKEAKPEPVLNDLFWSLLNSKEFVFNH